MLILGASGGVGGSASQLAKSAGATVVAVASAESAAHMKKLGADFAIDYKAGPVAESVRRVAPNGIDPLFDAASGDAHTQSLATLKANARLISVLHDGKALNLPAGIHFQPVMAQPSVADLDYLTVPVAATFPLDATQKAFEQMETHHTTGKVVIIP